MGAGELWRQEGPCPSPGTGNRGTGETVAAPLGGARPAPGRLGWMGGNGPLAIVGDRGGGRLGQLGCRAGESASTGRSPGCARPPARWAAAGACHRDARCDRGRNSHWLTKVFTSIMKAPPLGPQGHRLVAQTC
ncbi:hypothetical protein chiPu_0027155 [Chiloscyllium punctatum]|uniref:Uncharacterized protein n=1 Tax=Chiloscyllium punctatum TaxID=137246 RepID=A0A401TJS0_CHIPU|nr:hypothetical protein [Chiloscyllium punctatum]